MPWLLKSLNSRQREQIHTTGEYMTNRGAGRTFPAGGTPGQVPTTDAAGNTTWVENGARTVRAVTATTATAAYGDVILGDTTSNVISVTLPTPTVGQAPITVKRQTGSSNALTVLGTIDGSTNLVVTAAKTFFTDGTNWFTA
jgi:hypothetical protein